MNGLSDRNRSRLTLFVLTAGLAACSSPTGAPDACDEPQLHQRGIRRGEPEPIGTEIRWTEREKNASVMLVVEREDGFYFFCGATIVAPHFVLTVAQCTNYWENRLITRELLEAGKIWVAVGPDLVKGYYGAIVDKIINHPGYPSMPPDPGYWDIALVRTKGSLLRDGKADTIGFPAEMLPNPAAGEEKRSVDVIGYGRTKVEALSEDYTPSRKWSRFEVSLSTPYGICGYAQEGRTVCAGDSGSGAFVPDPATGRPLVAAATITGDVNCMGQATRSCFCSTYPDKIDWLRETMGEEEYRLAALGVRGVCEGQIARWYDDTTQAETTADCAQLGGECGTTVDGLQRCLRPTTCK